MGIECGKRETQIEGNEKGNDNLWNKDEDEDKKIEEKE